MASLTTFSSRFHLPKFPEPPNAITNWGPHLQPRSLWGNIPYSNHNTDQSWLVNFRCHLIWFPPCTQHTRLTQEWLLTFLATLCDKERCVTIKSSNQDFTTGNLAVSGKKPQVLWPLTLLGWQMWWPQRCHQQGRVVDKPTLHIFSIWHFENGVKIDLSGKGGFRKLVSLWSHGLLFFHFNYTWVV